MNTIKIGSQEWATEDLKVTKFRNGEDIPLVTDNEEWAKLETAAYCVTSRGNYLYNWYAVNDIRGLAPEGFYVPTDAEWTELIDFLGGKEIAGEKMKTKEWGGNNQSGFSALPSGSRDSDDGFFYSGGYYGHWWSSSAYGTDYAWVRYLNSDDGSVYRVYYYQRYGFSVRCLKNIQHQREMKTPMQELLERVQEYRDAETSSVALSRLNSVCVDILGMLQKEKDVMCEFAFTARLDDYLTPDELFDKTFNTTE